MKYNDYNFIYICSGIIQSTKTLSGIIRSGKIPSETMRFVNKITQTDRFRREHFPCIVCVPRA